jgi:hypothetical protein
MTHAIRRPALGTALLLGLGLGARAALGQQAPQAQPPLEPYRGVTSAGTVEPGLYHLQRTGLRLQSMREAANAFLQVLTPEQRSHTQYPFNSDVRRLWTNVASAPRFGLSYAEMTPLQRQRADGLLRAFLSAEGYRQSKDIMLINGYLAEATGNSTRYGADQFWISFYGNPSGTQPWAWRLEGHHLVLFVSVVGDQVVMTPTFMGAEPTRIPSGLHSGISVMAREEATGRALIQSLTPAQNQRAQLSSSKQGSNMLTEAYKDNAVVAPAGIEASQLSKRQRQLLLAVVKSYADQYRQELSAERLREVEEHLNQTSFAWIGQNAVEAPIYYRIFSPVLLIEFDQQRAVSLPGDPKTPLRTHVHTIVRTPNGNDYGADLLRQHLLRYHSAQPTGSAPSADPKSH